VPPVCGATLVKVPGRAKRLPRLALSLALLMVLRPPLRAELSQAGTTDFMQGDPSALTPPESPPWRRKNEGGILAEIPPIGSYPARAGGEGLHAAALAARAQAPAQGGSMPRGVSDSELSSQDSSSKGGAAGKVDPGKPGMSAAAAAATAAGRRGSALGQGGAGNAQQEQQQQAASTRGGSGVGEAAGGAPALPVPVPGKQVTLGMTFGRGDGQTGLDIVRLKDGGVAQLQSDLAVGDQARAPARGGCQSDAGAGWVSRGAHARGRAGCVDRRHGARGALSARGEQAGGGTAGFGGGPQGAEERLAR